MVACIATLKPALMPARWALKEEEEEEEEEDYFVVGVRVGVRWGGRCGSLPLRMASWGVLRSRPSEKRVSGTSLFRMWERRERRRRRRKRKKKRRRRMRPVLIRF
jgi:hypothetical protein